MLRAPKPGSCKGAPVYTVRGCTPGAKVWKVSLVTTCKPASGRGLQMGNPCQADLSTAFQGLTLKPGLNREPTAPASDATMMPLHGRSTSQHRCFLKTHIAGPHSAACATSAVLPVIQSRTHQKRFWAGDSRTERASASGSAHSCCTLATAWRGPGSLAAPPAASAWSRGSVSLSPSLLPLLKAWLWPCAESSTSLELVLGPGAPAFAVVPWGAIAPDLQALGDGPEESRPERVLCQQAI